MSFASGKTQEMPKIGPDLTKGAELLGNLAERTTKGAEKMMDNVEKIVTNLSPKESAALAALTVGALLYIVSGNIKDKLKKKEQRITKEEKEPKKETQETKPPVKDTREELRRLAETCPVLPIIPPKLSDEMPKNLSGTAKGVARAVEIAVKNGIRGDHCWDWTEKVYHLAGCKRRIIFNSVPKYASNQYEIKDGKKVYKKVSDCGVHHAYEKEYAQLEPGDHIFVNNKNQYDNHGNHSEIFLGWVDRSKLIAKTAGYPGKNRPPYISNSRNFNKTPITYIAKPFPIDKQRPLVA